jgi:hypothetical protein
MPTTARSHARSVVSHPALIFLALAPFEQFPDRFARLMKSFRSPVPPATIAKSKGMDFIMPYNMRFSHFQYGVFPYQFSHYSKSHQRGFQQKIRAYRLAGM